MNKIVEKRVDIDIYSFGNRIHAFLHDKVLILRSYLYHSPLY
jgi:hypothetical protein